METTPSFFERLRAWSRRSVTLKLLSIGILILLMLIPTGMISSLIRERRTLRDESLSEVSSKWGYAQTIAGPVISVPYIVRSLNDKGKTEYETRFAHFLPESLTVKGNMLPEKRYRGIYVVVLYNAKLQISGTFSSLNLRPLGIPVEDYRFDEAFVSVGISDMKGINGKINVHWNDSVYSLNPGIVTHDVFNSGASAQLTVSEKQQISFSYELDLNGSTSLRFAPFGKETSVNIQSAWGSPSFEGYTLPQQRTVNDTGFAATWSMTQLNRNYPQQGTGKFINVESGGDGYSNDQNDGYASFGVRLMLPVDEYQKTERSVKYCIMFIVITFITFFFVETMGKRRIHPIQYLLVGFAICLFYVLLLSISEQLNFDKAYMIGCVATLGLISYYAAHVFNNRKLSLIFSGMLALLYGFFYSLLQLEDYALLLGSIGLFIILGTIMYLTRKINWYEE